MIRLRSREMDSSNSKEEAVPSWSGLPKELLSDIEKRLNTNRIHVLRLHSVCPSWRSSVPPFTASPIKLSIPIPPGFEDSIDPFGGQFNVIESTLYRLEPCPPTQEKQIFLVQVVAEENEPNCLRFVTPIIEPSSNQVTFPKEVNLLDYRVTEICKTYEADNYVYDGQHMFEEPPKISRIVFLHSDPSLKGRYGTSSGRIYPILVTLEAGLSRGIFDPFFLKPGDDEKWTWLSHNGDPPYFYDFIDYKGKFYCVTCQGGAFSVDSSGNLTEIVSPISEDEKWYCFLVQSLGDLFLLKVDGYWSHRHSFELLKLDEENHKWEETKSLGGRVLFVGDHGLSFSLLAHDFPRCKEGCIYQTAQYSKPYEIQRPFTTVYNLEDGSIQGELHGHPLWSYKDLHSADTCSSCID